MFLFLLEMFLFLIWISLYLLLTFLILLLCCFSFSESSLSYKLPFSLTQNFFSFWICLFFSESSFLTRMYRTKDGRWSLRSLKCVVVEPLRSGNLWLLLASSHGKTQKARPTGFVTIVRREKPNRNGYKFRFTQLNRLCLVLPWLDARTNLVKFPLLELDL